MQTRQEINESCRRYYWANRDKIRARKAKNYSHQKFSEYYKKNLVKRLEWQRLNWVAAREYALLHYAKDGKIECVCCGEKERDFLALDHINGLGEVDSKHRRHPRVIDLEHLGYPKGLQILCHNCNSAKGFYGVCPHQRKASLSP